MARQRQAGSYTWTQVKSVQNLIERCLNQYMTQAEVIATLQVQADVDPALTCLVWSKLEEANPDFFLSYVRLKLKDQVAGPTSGRAADAAAAQRRWRCLNRARWTGLQGRQHRRAHYAIPPRRPAACP